MQPGNLLAERLDQPGLARLGAQFGKKCLQARHLARKEGTSRAALRSVFVSSPASLSQRRQDLKGHFQ